MPVAALKKMRVEYNDPVDYYLDTDEGEWHVNDYLGKELSLRFTGEITCTGCGISIKKTYGQGFCYKCFMESPLNSPCMVRPELCRAHLGEGRDPEWEELHHNQPHVVYLALTSKVKVGITRQTTVPSRWIDQGAWKIIVLARTNNRYESGLIELSVKDHLSDKTNWRHMLTDVRDEHADLVTLKDRISLSLPDQLRAFVTNESDITEIHYPVLSYPRKVTALSFDKTPEIRGKLYGIRGQYFLFDNGRVLNIRKFTGYHIALETTTRPGSQFALDI